MADLARESDDRLLASAADDAAAFSAFYRRYEPAMLAYFARRVGDPELAADLTAEVFAAVLVSCGRYRPARAPAQAWLFAIAQHKLANSRRRGRVEDRARRRLGMAPVALEDEDLERIERLAGRRDIAMQALAGLPADQREAVLARIVDERDYAEMATELRCSESVARKRVSRGLAQLRDQLGKEST
ncbi:MAG TPA: RNA polymerase sigma factor [Solirubrobacteraceae bacterium]|jgi:RNA polymerase sigma-70 factor (ECF subfamily)|nr:RNA polymerase sigma factor [Solirubrobacteraceae bacterium]